MVVFNMHMPLEGFPRRTNASMEAKLQALERLRVYLRTEYDQETQAYVVREGGVEMAKEANTVVVFHWLVKDGAVVFLDSAARNPTKTYVSTIYSLSEIEEFVQVLNDYVREDVRTRTLDVCALAKGWVFNMTADEARKLFV